MVPTQTLAIRLLLPHAEGCVSLQQMRRSHSLLDDVLPPVRALFEVAESDPRRGELEVELRFGTVGSSGSFVPGVSRDFLDSAIRRLQTNAACHSTEWVEHEDYFFSIDVAPHQKQQVRTRVTFDAAEFRMNPAHVIKKRVASVTIVAGDLAMRVALSRETPVGASVVPTSVQTDMVRIQQRKSIYWSRQECKSPPWCYEMSLTWAGKTRSEAEMSKAQTNECTHEFEIELNLKSPYVACHSSDYLARSMLLKGLDFVGACANLTIHNGGGA